MKIKLRKLTSVCLALTMLLSILSVASFSAGAVEKDTVAVSSESGDFEYELLDEELYGEKTASITGYNGNETDLIIPSEIDGYEIVKISSYAFLECLSLTSVTIPDSVTVIGHHAFAGCTNLTDITIPDSIKALGGEAFIDTQWYNNQPDGVVYVGKFVYNYKGDMPENTYLTLKDGTIGIAQSAFLSCESLAGIKISDSVSFIDDTAFFNCKSLTSITIPENVTEISRGVFELCTSLTDITIPNSVSVIDKYAFDNCTGLTDVIIPEGVQIIESKAFINCSNLKSVTILGDATSIGEYAFGKCESLENITISDNVHQIDRIAFFNCPKLTSVTIPYSVTSIGEYAFGYLFDEEAQEIRALDGFTIYGYTGSEAEKYANENGFEFVSIGDIPTSVIGDVNGDGKVNIDDVTDIQKYIANMIDFTDEQMELADVDKDGKILIDDVTLIQMYLAEIATI